MMTSTDRPETRAESHPAPRASAGFLTRTSPSASLVISVLALVVALSSAATAAVVITGQNVKNGSLTGADIKNNSLTGKEIKKNSLKAKDLARDSVGSSELRDGIVMPRNLSDAAKAGMVGPAGPAGPQGATGPRGVSGYQRVYREVTLPASSAAQKVEMDCPAGTKVLGGGGWWWQPDEFTLSGTYSQAGGDGWVLTVRNNMPGPRGVFIHALCAAVN